MASCSSASNTSMSPSQSSATPTAEDDGVFYETEFVDGAPYTRKRPSGSQIGALQASYDANQYPSREERMALADKIDMPYSAVTNWFQNRRQSSNRKAWTIAARNKRRTRAKEAAQRPSRMSGLSLDHVASLLERRSNSPVHTRPNSVIPLPLTPQKRRTISASELVNHMPSSPPEPQSSPSTGKFRTFADPTAQIKPVKSLEWACARARVQRRDKENRPLTKRAVRWKSEPSKGFRSRATSAPELGRLDNEEEMDDESETEVEPDEALTPVRTKSMSTVRTRSFTEDHQEEAMRKNSGTGADMEAAMMLLGFMKGA